MLRTCHLTVKQILVVATSAIPVHLVRLPRKRLLTHTLGYDAISYNTSASCSPVGMYCSSSSLLAYFSCRKWYRTSMCLVHAWYAGFFAMAIADWLSMSSVVGASCSSPNSESKVRSHTASFAACAPVMYSASMLESAVAPCFFELQLTAAPKGMKM